MSLSLEERVGRLERIFDQMSKLVPPGTIQAFATSEPFEGWLVCNGKELSRKRYNSLFESIGTTFGDGNGYSTFNIPDLQGQFIRGWDIDGNVDSQRKFGSFQDDAFQGHGHDISAHTHEVECDKKGGHRHYFKSDWATDNDLFATSKKFLRLEKGGDKGAGDRDGEHSHTITIKSANSRIKNPKSSNYGKVNVDNETRPKNVSLLFCIKV